MSMTVNSKAPGTTAEFQAISLDILKPILNHLDLAAAKATADEVKGTDHTAATLLQIAQSETRYDLAAAIATANLIQTTERK
jgi:hypothetical protein